MLSLSFLREKNHWVQCFLKNLVAGFLRHTQDKLAHVLAAMQAFQTEMEVHLPTSKDVPVKRVFEQLEGWRPVAWGYGSVIRLRSPRAG
ncbi:MAG: hypothetical protein N3D11_05970 [Candidatus Sumerlaeia bacterium]|nr:hypothetical protein [Candidatus Sumerlaeia bacterium]